MFDKSVREYNVIRNIKAQHVTTVDTNNKYILVRNATEFKLEKLYIYSFSNLGYDSRPSMALTLRLRGPKQ